MFKTPRTVMHKTQPELVLDHLKAEGSISGVEAEALYKIRHLPSKVFALRAQGYEITSQFCKDHCGQRYVRYRLSRAAALRKAQQQELFHA